MKIQHSVNDAPCLFDMCKFFIKDEGNYIIGIECLICRFFAKRDNRVFRNE